jgi:threonine-phosphate decarboxylase
LVLGNGSSALIFAAIRALRPGRALLLEPAFGEYRRALRASGVEVEAFLLKEEDSFIPDFGALTDAIRSGRYDVVILNSPHNPTGALYPKNQVLALAEATERGRASLVVDEAFIDYAPEASLLPEAAQWASVIVLRSLTKFYAIPGLRIGYAVCHPALAKRVRAQIEAWAVSSIALDAALAAISDSEYERIARERNRSAREQFSLMLDRLPGVKPFPSAANFLLVKFDRIKGIELERWLHQHRILIRRCDVFAGLGDEFVRLAVRSPEDNLRLAQLIESFILR